MCLGSAIPQVRHLIADIIAFHTAIQGVAGYAQFGRGFADVAPEPVQGMNDILFLLLLGIGFPVVTIQ